MWQIWIAAAGLAFTVVVTTIGATIRITRFISKENRNLEQLVYRKFTEAKSNLDTEADKLRHEFGETIKALRTHVEIYEEKLYNVELYIRDNYIEVPTFKEVINELKKDIKDLTKKLDDFFKRN